MKEISVPSQRAEEERGVYFGNVERYWTCPLGLWLGWFKEGIVGTEVPGLALTQQNLGFRADDIMGGIANCLCA